MAGCLEHDGAASKPECSFLQKSSKKLLVLESRDFPAYAPLGRKRASGDTPK
jgi:hypothetical protein